MITLGITGRSGCGKSTVTAVFAAKGYPAGRCRPVAAKFCCPVRRCCPAGTACSARILPTKTARCDRRLLADRAFATPEGKAALTDITHPEIVRRIGAALDEAARAGAPLPLWTVRSSSARRLRRAATH